MTCEIELNTDKNCFFEQLESEIQNMSFTNTSEASSLMSPLCGFSPLWDRELFWDPSGPRITPCLEQVGLPIFHLLFLLAVLPLEVNIYYISAISSLVFSVISMQCIQKLSITLTYLRYSRGG